MRILLGRLLLLSFITKLRFAIPTLASKTFFRDAPSFEITLVLGNGVERKFECNSRRDCEIRAHGFCATATGGGGDGMSTCVQNMMDEIKWRRPHLRVGPPSLGQFEQEEVGDDCVSSSRVGFFQEKDPIFDRIRGRSVRKVLVISYYTGHNFGDRLGVPILNSVLPPDVEIEHVPFIPCENENVCADISDVSHFDAVILGIGMSVYRPVLTDKLLNIMQSIPVRIGIFGTQYHDDIPLDRMKALLGMLDLWLARYETDVNRFGHLVPENRTIHLGDWMISACPMRDPSTRQTVTLYIPPNVLYDEVHLDRFVENVQSARYVFSGRLHPLLCALPSAKAIAYVEQREKSGKVQSGKFESMFLDVFSKKLKPETWLPVNRNCVLEYKRMIESNMRVLRNIFSTWIVDTSNTVCEDNDDDATAGVGRTVYLV